MKCCYGWIENAYTELILADCNKLNTIDYCGDIMFILKRVMTIVTIFFMPKDTENRTMRQWYQ